MSTPQLVCGLMSGTSCDAVDGALVWTNGVDYLRLGPTMELPIPSTLREKIRTLQQWADKTYESNDENIRQRVVSSFMSCSQRDAPNPHPLACEIEEELVQLHALVVAGLLQQLPKENKDSLSLIGYHGQTITHFPPSRTNLSKHDRPPLTWQLGDGQKLATLTQTPVVFRFRDNDILLGGEGAPLAPAYHRCLSTSMLMVTTPSSQQTDMKEAANSEIAVLNIGGVSNITICTSNTNTEHDGMLAFDVGPGNALLDDFMMQRTTVPMDMNGTSALSGTPNEDFIRHAMQNGPLGKFLQGKAPKSCDRDQFIQSLDMDTLSKMSTQDGAASLTMLTARCVCDALSRVPSWTHAWRQTLSSSPRLLVVSGGGRKNSTLMSYLSTQLGNHVRVVTTEEIEWRGDSVEAEAFAYLAVRSIRNLPLSWPGTTGVQTAATGGVLVHPEQNNNK
jgi:anhydro-N-acetylmuramic acid kinase